LTSAKTTTAASSGRFSFCAGHIRWHALCVFVRMHSENLSFPLACAAVLLLAACERPVEHVIPSGAENNSRNAAPPVQIANELAREVPPVAPAPPTSLGSAGAISDTMITGKVKAELFTDPGMEGSDVSVSADRGVVILAGTVASYEQSALASAHAQHQDGVMRVDNQLSLALR
jgi:hypothetical protein